MPGTANGAVPLPVPNLPDPPEPPAPPRPPRVHIGRAGSNLRFLADHPRFQAHAAGRNLPRPPHAPGNPANQATRPATPPPPPATPPAPPPPPTAGPNQRPQRPRRQVAEWREALGRVAGRRTTGEPALAGMPAGNQRLLHGLTRAQIREHVRGYHGAGADYLQQQRRLFTEATQRKAADQQAVSDMLARNRAAQAARDQGQFYNPLTDQTTGGTTP